MKDRENDMIIEDSKVVEYVYDTGYEQFCGKTREEAEMKFEDWINSHTPYRGVSMYAKHKGYYFYYRTENGKKYCCNGGTWYRTDEYHNIWVISPKDVR